MGVDLCSLLSMPCCLIDGRVEIRAGTLNTESLFHPVTVSLYVTC